MGFILCVLIAGFTAKSVFRNEPRTYYVTRVIDGDTIVLNNGARVRYIGIDTPELSDTRPSIRRMAYAARGYNRRLVAGSRITLEYDIERFDKYHRLLAYVYVNDLFVNAEMVREGYARTLTYPPNVLHTSLFERLQNEAKNDERGIWQAEERAP